MDMNGETQFFWGRIEVGGEEALIFININCLQAFVDAVELHMDATFHSAPNGFTQLASLHTIAFNTVGLDPFNCEK
jgi:hypothetical protein